MLTTGFIGKIDERHEDSIELVLFYILFEQNLCFDKIANLSNPSAGIPCIPGQIHTA